MSRRGENAAAVGVALVGFGLAGEVFHAPLIRSTPGLHLRAVVSSRTSAIAAAGLVSVARIDEVLDDPAVALVVIATPSGTHFEIASRALTAGKHVVVDKPFALTSREAEALIALATAQDRKLTVFHNRRWDGDFLTVQRLLEQERLGEVSLYEACWDRYRPAVAHHWKDDAEPGGGIVYDLAPHLIDQALCLFGAPDRVVAEIRRQRSGARADDFFDLRLGYGERIVRLSASMLVSAPRPRFALHGASASFVKFGLDPQQDHLKAGLRPGQRGYGLEPRSRFGHMTTSDGSHLRIPIRRGQWRVFYEGLVLAIVKGGPVPVDPRHAWTGLKIIEAAMQSAADGRTIAIEGLQQFA